MAANIRGDPVSDPTLLLLHGLGATSGVWSDLQQHLRWQGRVLAPDLIGHGTAPWAADYSLGAFAAGVSTHCRPDEEVVIIGHSLGGAVGLCLASGFFRPRVTAVLGVGIKVNWTDEDVAGVAKVAAKGIRWVDGEAEAVERFLRQAGLAGLVGPDHSAVTDAVVEEGGRWRVAQDPATFAQKALNTRALVDAANCPVILGAGEDDAMVDESELAAYVHQPRIAPGCGHNVQVEDPGWVAAVLSELVSLADR